MSWRLSSSDGSRSVGNSSSNLLYFLDPFPLIVQKNATKKKLTHIFTWRGKSHGCVLWAKQKHWLQNSKVRTERDNLASICLAFLVPNPLAFSYTFISSIREQFSITCASSLGTALFLNCYFKHVCKAKGLGMAIGYRVCLLYVKKNKDSVSFWGKGWAFWV